MIFFDYKIIGKLSHLTALAIFPPIVHANAIHLTALTNLKKLYLYIEDFIPETFTRLTQLKKFTIQTSDSRPLTQLQYLTSLRCLRINTPERKCISLNLQALTGLNNLECYANQLETLDYFPSLTYLHLENINENLSSSFYSLLNKAHLNSLTSLTSLTLYLDECVPPYFDLLSRLIHLKSFYLNYWDGVVTLTGQLTQLNKLAIKAKNILLQNPLAINHLTFLVLNAREPVHSVDSQLNLLTRLTNLHYLSLDLKINLQEMQTILETLPNLRFLDYKGPYQTGTWLKNLKGNDFYYKLLNEQLI